MERYSIYPEGLGDINVEIDKDGDWVKFDDINSFQDVQSKRNWISVEDRLPLAITSIIVLIMALTFLIAYAITSKDQVNSFNKIHTTSYTHDEWKFYEKEIRAKHRFDNLEAKK